MPNNRRNSRNRGPPRRRTQPPSLQVLRDIRGVMEDQALHQSPMVPDVQMMKIARNRVCSFVGAYDATTISVSSTAPSGGAFATALANVTGYGDLAAVFDQYRIMQLVFTFEVVGSPAAVQAAGANFYTALDYDDQTAPTSQAVLQQYDTCMNVPVGTYFKRVFNPRIAYAAYGSGAFTSYANQKAGWIDVASPGVAHYGVKYWINQGSSSLVAYNVAVQVFLQFRSQR